MKRESLLRTKIVAKLKEKGATPHVYHATPYGETGHSDIYGAYKGRAFYFEVKPPEWVPRGQKEKTHFAQQVVWLGRQLKSGAVCAVVRSPETALYLLYRHVDKGVDISLDNVYIEPVIQ